MICEVDSNGIITNLVDTDIIVKPNEKPYYPWLNMGDVYTDEIPLEYAKTVKLAEIDAWTAAKITGGFVSNASGEAVTYDSDKDTQLTMQGIALNVNTELFAEKYPDGCPVRGYPTGSETKQIYMLTPTQVMQWLADLSIHIGTCKQNGWIKQAEVNAATTVEDVNAVVLN